MKFSIMFKTPDCFDQVLDDESLSDEDKEECIAFAVKYVKWNEVVTVDFDTKKCTAVVRVVK